MTEGPSAKLSEFAPENASNRSSPYSQPILGRSKLP